MQRAIAIKDTEEVFPLNDNCPENVANIIAHYIENNYTYRINIGSNKNIKWYDMQYYAEATIYFDPNEKIPENSRGAYIVVSRRTHIHYFNGYYHLDREERSSLASKIMELYMINSLQY